MYLELITPEKVLYSGEIYLVRVPGTKGSFEILDKHMPIVSTLETGQIKIITKDGVEKFYDIKQGFVEVKDNKTKVLVTQ